MTTEQQKQGQQPATTGRYKSWMLWGGLGIVAAVILGVIASIQSGSGGSSPDFRMVAYQGQDILGDGEVDFSRVFRHGKPVVLNFWAGLCPPCRAEMPSFQRIYDDLGDEFILVGVDVGPFSGLGTHEDARQLLRDLHIRFPVSYAITSDPLVDYNVLGMPTTVFLTPDGQVFYQWTGALPEARLRSEIQNLLDASS